MRFDELRESAEHVRLEIARTFQAELFDASLCGWAAVPLRDTDFVAAEVDVFRREEIEDLGENILVESDRGLFGVERIAVDAPGGPDFDRFSGVPEVGVGGNRGSGMTGEFDLGDDVDEVVGGVLDDLADVGLGVEAAVGCVVIFGGGVFGAADDGGFPPRADGGQFRIFFDLDSPPLIIRQMPVEGVHFVHGQEVNFAA